METWIKLVFGVLCIAYTLFIVHKHKNELIDGIKGVDNKFQLTEIAALLWFMFFGFLFFYEMLFHEASKALWDVLMIIYATTILGDSAVRIKKGQPPKLGKKD